MKKHTEKPPIDDLFARKLGNMSLPTDPRGFERLQARMGQNRPEAHVVFWRNPDVQRYTAAAACLLLVCLFGWLYWPSETQTTQQPQVATKQTSPVHPQKSAKEQANQLAEKQKPTLAAPVVLDQEKQNERLATVERSSGSKKVNHRSIAQPVEVKKVVLPADVPVRSEAILSQTKPTETKVNAEVAAPHDVVPANQATQEQVADKNTVTKAMPTTERVLVVTIEEPASLVAARQAAKTAIEEKSIVATNDKPEKETKSGGLWQQVKRIKQGELFAHRDNAANEDRGLLGRAYTGLKHSFDKDKSAKQ